MTAARIHIVDRFDVPWSGSTLSAISLSRLLSPHCDARLWSLTPVHPSFLDKAAAIDEIDGGSGRHPRGGTLLIHGSHAARLTWLSRAEPERIVLLCNITLPQKFLETLLLLRGLDLPEPDLVFRSAQMQHLLSLPGAIEIPLVDLEVFRPRSRGANSPFIVGRHSRDELYKHSEDDPSLYRMLALAGVSVRLMGGTCLEEYLGPDRNGIELLPTGIMPPPKFLNGLDCFFYRTGTMEEALGRVVLEAMACGLPVVCHRRGGHAEIIGEGENGLLFDTQEEAFDLLMALRESTSLRKRLGAAARSTVEALFAPARLEKIVAYYLAARSVN